MPIRVYHRNFFAGWWRVWWDFAFVFTLVLYYQKSTRIFGVLLNFIVIGNSGFVNEKMVLLNVAAKA